MAQDYHDEKTGDGPLSQLAAELMARDYHAVLRNPSARKPTLRVVNPEVPVRASVITACAGWYWWSDLLQDHGHHQPGRGRAGSHPRAAPGM
jgi:hypothetical protein